MNIKHIFMAASAVLALTACSSDDKAPRYSDTPIRLQTSIGQMTTRSQQGLQDTRFKVNTTFDVQITSNDGLTEYNQMTYKVTSTQGALAPSNGVYPYYPINGSGVKIRAIYPTGYMNESSFTVQSTQTDDDSYLKSDLMFATADVPAIQTDPVDLEFYHKLTKICINLTPDDAKVNLAGAQVKLLKLYTSVEYNPITGEIGNVTGSKDDMLIQMGGEESTVECAAVIVPQTFQGGYLIEIRLANNDILNYRTMQTIPFESGKKYIYNINVRESGITVSSTVKPWLPTDDIEGPTRLPAN